MDRAWISLSGTWYDKMCIRDRYKVGYQPGEEYQKFIDQMIKDSDVDTGVKPQTSNKILTLSTCTGNGYSKRLAIHAVCVDAQTTDESKLKETGN